MPRKVNEQKMLEREIRKTKKDIGKKQLELGGFVVESNEVFTQIHHLKTCLRGIERELAELRS